MLITMQPQQPATCMHRPKHEPAFKNFGELRTGEKVAVFEERGRMHFMVQGACHGLRYNIGRLQQDTTCDLICESYHTTTKKE